MELRIGSLVKIRSDLKLYGVHATHGSKFFVTNSMYENRGREFSVTELMQDGSCRLELFDNDTYFVKNMFSHIDGEELTHEDLVARCPICGNPMEDGQEVCDDCEERARRIIGSYHSFGDYSTNAIGGEEKLDSLTIGAELEVEISCSHKREFTALKCKSKDTNNIIHFERDGSLSNGFEIITQPMTFKYWQEVYANDLVEILKTANENGGKSHDTDTCGLHFHVGKNCLQTSSRTKDDVIDNVLLIVETFKKEIEKFARRKNNRYCRFLSGSDTDTLDMDTVKQLKVDRGRDRYSAVNIGNSNTIEFRVFKGTLKFETFMASLELVNNIVNIAKFEDIQGMTWNDIINYNSEMNKYLTQYNETLNISTSKSINILSYYETNKELFSVQNLIDGNFEIRLSGSNAWDYVAFGILIQVLKDKGVTEFCENNLQALTRRMRDYDYLSVNNGVVSIYDGARFRGNGSAKKKVELVKLVELYDKYSELLEI